MNICIKGIGTYPSTLLSKLFLQKYLKKSRETQVNTQGRLLWRPSGEIFEVVP